MQPSNTPHAKSFRLFISSTFNDFQQERALLQTEVFPIIKEYANEKGYSFQPIDLRWGVSNEAQYDQKTLDLCLNEVHACKVKPYPNFLVMLGNRYGWIALPYAIEQQEFETLYAHIPQEEKTFVDEWYKLDTNQIPASYILQERTPKYYDWEVWAEVETQLLTTLQSAVKKTSLSQEKIRKYFLSATEAEIEEGVIPYIEPTPFHKKHLLSANKELHQIDPEHIFCFLRNINQQTLQDGKFSDGVAKVEDVKEELKKLLPQENLLEVTTKQISKEELELAYLQTFKERVTQFLKHQIDLQYEHDKENVLNLTPLELDKEQQANFAQSKRKNFIAQTKPLQAIKEYVENKTQTTSPFIIYAQSGMGKSALMAQAIKEVQTYSNKKIIYRFVGATPSSNSSQDLLKSIFEELGFSFTQQESKDFEEFSKKVYTKFFDIKEDVVIFIDAIDQVNNEDNFLWLPTNLPSNVKVVISALQDSSYQKDSSYFQTLQRRLQEQNLYKLQKFDEAQTLLLNTLKQYSRTLTQKQLKYFLELYEKVQTPLYVTIAAQELRHWKSSDTTQTLASTQKGIIEEFVSNLWEFYHNDKTFVQRVLGYIYASRDGLSESEIITLLEEDKAFIEQVASEKFHKNLTKELPMVHWSRFFAMMEPFLSIKEQDNEELFYFFHREFEDAIANQPNQKEQHQNIIQATQTLLLKNQHKPFNANRWGKLYATLLSEYYLKYTEDKNQLQNYAEFLAKELQPEWIEEYLHHTLKLEEYHYKRKEILQALSYALPILHSIEALYSNNQERWAEAYTIALNNLADSYRRIGKIQEALELNRNSLVIIKKLYKEDPVLWVEAYTISLNSLSSSYLKANSLLSKWYKLRSIKTSYVDLIQKSRVLTTEALFIIKKFYEENPSKYRSIYIESLRLLASSHFEDKKVKKALELAEKVLTIVEESYKEEPEIWIADYIASLNQVALYSQYTRQLYKAIKLNKKSMNLIQNLYDKDPLMWTDTYLGSLSSLSDIYFLTKNLHRAIVLMKKYLLIVEELYKRESAVWIDDYIFALETLFGLYLYIGKGEESLKFLDMKFNLLKEYYGENDIKTRAVLKEVTFLKNILKNTFWNWVYKYIVIKMVKIFLLLKTYSYVKS